MRICWICILIIIGVDVSGQSYLTNTQHLTVEDGLSGRFAKDVQEDRQGFIWINTYNGLNRYDGFSFKFYSKPDYGFHLEDYEKLELDQAGRLWLIKLSLTEKGRSNELSQYIDVFDPSTEELMSEHVFSKAPFRIAEIKRIVAENQGGLWLQTVSGNFYRFDGNDFQLMFQRAKVDDFHLLSDGNLVAIDKTENKIIQVDKNGKFLQEWPLHQHFLLLAPDQHGGFIVGNILAKSNGKITQWRQYQAGQQIAVIQFTADLLPLSISGEQASFIYRLTQDDQQHWWLNDGLFLRVFSAKFNQIAAFPVENSSQNHLFTFFFDHYQNAWATSVDGVYIYQVKKNLFRHFLQVEEGFIDSRGIAELPDGKIVVNQNSTKIIDLEQGTIKEIGLGGTRGVLVDHNESLWLGKYAAGIIKYCYPRVGYLAMPGRGAERLE